MILTLEPAGGAFAVANPLDNSMTFEERKKLVQVCSYCGFAFRTAPGTSGFCSKGLCLLLLIIFIACNSLLFHLQIVKLAACYLKQ